MAAARSRSRTVETPKRTSELESVLSEVNKEYGSHVARPASSKAPFKHCPTGVFTLDMALLGGIPEGLTTCFYGWESSGKTTMAMRAVGRMQEKYPDSRCVFIDVEGTYDGTWAHTHGVDNDKMILVQPETGEQAVDIMDAVVRAEDTSLIVVDSIAALTPFKEVDSSASDALVGVKARLMARFFGKMQQAMLDERKRGHFPTLLCINQYAYKIGVMYGDPRTLPGGVKQNFMYSVKCEFMNKEKVEKGKDVASYNEHSFRITKNKCGNSLKQGEFIMTRDPSGPLGAGFVDDAKTVATYGRKFGLITGGGSSWKIDGVNETFGKLEEIREYFYSDLDFFEEFKKRLITRQRQEMGVPSDGWF